MARSGSFTCHQRTAHRVDTPSRGFGPNPNDKTRCGDCQEVQGRHRQDCPRSA